MPKIDSFSSYDWMSALDTRIEIDADERQSLPLYEIIWGFKASIDSNEQVSNENEKVELAEKVKILSEEKLDYYCSSRFGFIKQLFSALRNGLFIGRWQSSGQLGLELSRQVITQSKLKQPEDEDSEAIPTWIKKKNLKEKRQQEKVKKGIKPTLLTEKIQQSASSSQAKVSIKNSFPVGFTQTPENIDKEQILLKNQKNSEEEQESGTENVDSESFEFSSGEEARESTVTTVSIQPAQAPKIKTAKEQMMDTLQKVWETGTPAERAFILQIWEILTKRVEVVSWSSTEKPNEYQVELDREIHGNHSGIPIGYLVLKQRMKVAFTEKYDPELCCDKHILTFVDSGLCHRVGKGWFSKDTAVKSITLKEDYNHKVWCSGTVMGQEFEVAPYEILYFLQEAQWS